jgi:epsin
LTEFYLLNCIIFFLLLSTEASAGSSNQVDLFGQDLIGDFMDAPTSVSVEKPATSDVSAVDLFADAAFVSAPPHVDKGASSQPQVRLRY